MKKLIGIITIVALMTGSLLYYVTFLNQTLQETIANFPIDETKKYKHVETTIELIDQNDEDEYTLIWKTKSEINEKLYLSHDISLLFEDGRLKEILTQAKENSSKLTQSLKIAGEDSGHYEAISYHYGQLHYPNDITKSVQSMSYDQIYILDSPLSPLVYFKSPETTEEQEGKRVLDTIINQNLQYNWEELIDYFQINSENYHSVPLTSLHKYGYTTFPELTSEESRELIAQTWGAIYQYYFLGIEKQDGTVVSPLASSVPLILYHKTYSHFIIIFSSTGGQKYSVVKNTGRF
ncbi:hypothetical protein H1D32_19715 [Anaerobacillus sp. CMMVII]|uniref:hypothetical protein n=1 Tax=Anaerobacillus sp. CMMVII TaxID=2755588 RepID=UPI0021B7C5C8|nr:hypothetical protein [Anaerobacillus sp. CMMVII]MCT8139735.1 hypothetical protein [Anaerobacillus sp. CMMVII]